MRAGRLRHKAKIYTLISTPDEFGSIDTTFELWKTVPAQVTTWRTDERFLGPGDLSTVLYKIRVRYKDDIADLSPTAEVEVHGKRLSVLGVADPDGMSRDLIITAEDRQ